MATEAAARTGRPVALGRPLPRAFYERHVLVVAKASLGRLLVHASPQGVAAGLIVEVEAYRGQRDPASHAFRGWTPRNAVMFGPAGRAYVYFTYGMHHCLNLVAEGEGRPAAVLVRALDPVHGVALMERRRGIRKRTRLARGPGCVARALGLSREHNGIDLVGETLWVSDLRPWLGDLRVVSGPRIGIRQGLDLQWRFYLSGHACVSGGSSSRDAFRRATPGLASRVSRLPR